MPGLVPADATSCPRCREALEPTVLREVPLRLCRKCTGVLLPQIDLARLLEAMSAELLKTFDPDLQLHPVVDGGGPLRCPRCGEAMTNDDYCEAGIVHFDRCEGCSLLWLETGELGAMTLMWARMDARRDRVEAENRERYRELSSFVDAIVLAHATANALYAGLP